MAPELTLGQQYDSSVDVFAFGVLAFIVMTGNFYPYAVNASKASSTPPNVQMIVASDPTCRPNLKESMIEPEWARDLCSSCWDNDANARPTFSEIVEIMKKEGKEDGAVMKKGDVMHFSEEMQSKVGKDEMAASKGRDPWRERYEREEAKWKNMKEQLEEMADRLTKVLKENEALKA